jgi:hypothetical protein
MRSGSTLASFLRGSTPLSAQGLIDLISEDEEFDDLYELNAGVEEEYTIREHTEIVLQSFIQEYADQPEVQEILSGSLLTREEFMLFLALHDIGKGKAVKEVPQACEKRKKLELEYTINAIKSFCEKCYLEKLIPAFEALLIDDAVGDYLKKNAPCLALAKKTADCVRIGAEQSKLPVLNFLKLKILFHRVDAGSYSYLREKIFKTDPNKKITLGRFYQPSIINYSAPILAKIKQIELAVRTEHPLQQPFPPELATRLKATIQDYSLTEIIELKKLAKQLNASNHLSPEQSSHLNAHLIEIEEAHLPFRTYRHIKMGSAELNLQHQNRQTRENLKKVIHEGTISPEVQHRLQLLANITFIHGSNSAALAIMHLSNQYELQCVSTLLSQGIAPMGGTFDIGSSFCGVNQHCLSVETVRNIPLVLKYAQKSPFKPKEIESLRNPLIMGDSSWEMNFSSFNYDFRILSIWRALDRQEFDRAFAPGTLANKFYLEMQEKYRQQLQNKINATDPSKNDKNLDSLDALNHLIKAVSTGEGWMAIEADSIDLSKDPNTSYQLNFMKGMILSPFSFQAQIKWWHRTSIMLLQYQQWDPIGFKEHILSQREGWVQAFDAARREGERPLKMLLSILDWTFNEEERFFLLTAFTDDVSQEMQIPERLQPLIGSLQELSQWKNARYNPLTPSTVKERLSTCFNSENAQQWISLLKTTLQDKLEDGEEVEYFKELRNGCELSLATIAESYQKLISRFDSQSNALEIPNEQTIRSLIKSPFPIIFGSTTVKPKCGDPKYVGFNEYHLDRPVPLGKGGCDLLFTDTEESKILMESLLPEHLKAQITIHLFKDLDVGSIPLVHHYDQIDRSSFSSISHLLK